MSELETEAETTRTEAAVYLRTLADQFEGDGDVILELGGTRVRLTPRDPVTVKLAGESDWSEGDGEATQSIGLELVWRRAAASAAEGTLDVDPVEQ